jgi:hypothetical protein
MELSPPNRLQGKISYRLFKTNPTFSRYFISFMVKLVPTLLGQISTIAGLSNAYLRFVLLTQQFMSYATLKVQQGTKTITLGKLGQGHQ